MADPLSIDEAKELIRLCETGRLYEVEAWIQAGKSLIVPAEIRKTPLKVAVATGFHSLIELLLRHEENRQVKNDSLRSALQMNRPPLVELAVNAGAEVASVPFLDVLLTGNRSTVATFLEYGADPVTNHPFARAFCDLRAKTTLGSFLDCRRMRPDLEPQLQEQADMALRQFCQEGNLKWVSLMLWIGANPRTRGPAVEDLEQADDPDLYTTALSEACASGNTKVLKLLKPDSSDDLAGMLERASFSAHRDLLAHLLQLGANPNDKPNGGSSALESCIRHLEWEDFDRIRYGHGPTYQTPAHKVSKSREAIKLLLEHGAIWKPSPAELNAARRALYRTEPEVTVELVGLLLKTAGGDAVRELLRTPRMQQHLAACRHRLSGLGLTLDGRKRPNSDVAANNNPVSHAPAQYDRDRLYEEIWSEPAKAVCARHGISEATLSTLCRALEIPIPPSGYWAMSSTARTRLERPSLLPLGFRKARTRLKR